MYIEFKNVFQNPNLVNSYSKNKTDEDLCLTEIEINFSNESYNIYSMLFFVLDS